MGNNKIKIMLTMVQALLWLIIGAAIGMVLASEMEGKIKLLIIMVISLLVIAFMAFLAYMMSRELNTNKDNNAAVLHRNTAMNRNDTDPNRIQSRRSAIDQHNSEAKINRNPRSGQQRELINHEVKQHIKKIVLINEEGQALREWSVAGKSGLLIGKSVNKDIVDIDLSDSAFANMISKQHAVINFTGDKWCVDDNDSKNGTRVKKLNQNAILDLKLTGTVEVDPGDIIYIANTMLQLR